jgi:hypothetical protein
MPTTIIAATACGDAALAASQVIAFAAYASALPTILLDLSESGPKTELIPSLSLPPSDALQVLRGLGGSVSAFIRVSKASAEVLEPLLPAADAVLVATTRYPADLEESFALYRSLTSKKAQGRSIRLLEPWLLPVGWSSTRPPPIRLWNWRRDLQAYGVQGLRCLPLVVPWTYLGSIAMADPARLLAIGDRMLRCVAAIAAGRDPARPERGIHDGDPWPTRSEPGKLPLGLPVDGLHPRFRSLHGA